MSDDYDQLRAVAEGFDIGEVVPDAFMRGVEAAFRVEVERCEAEARAVLTDRVQAELQSRLDGEFMDPSDGDSMRRAAEVAVSVFVEWLRNPPVREIQADGTERMRW